MIRVATLVLAGTAAFVSPVWAGEYQPNLAQVGVTPALQATDNGTGVKVAVLDGYADYDLNQDLTKNHGDVIVVYPGIYRYYDLHATHVSGIIGASVNGWGVVGVAPGATLYSIPVFDDRGWVANDLGKRALDAAVSRGVKVVNMSYGPTAKGDVFLDGELNLFDDYLKSLVIVRAEGNSGVNAINEFYAGKASTNLANLLIVGSVGPTNQISSFSTRPGEACIAATATCAESEQLKYWVIDAPGENILSDAPGKNTLAVLSGTSMATPTVAGAAALVISDGLTKHVALAPADVVNILKHSATDLGAKGVDGVYGWGLLNVSAALAPVGGVTIPTGPNVTNGGSSPAGAPKPKPAFAQANYDGIFSGSVVFDQYGRPFDASGIIVHPDLSGSLRALSALTASLGGMGAPAPKPGGVPGILGYAATGTATLGGGVGVVTFADSESRSLVGFGQPLSYFATAGTDVGTLSGGTRIAAGQVAAFGGANAAFDRALFASRDQRISDNLAWNAVIVSGVGTPVAPAPGWSQAPASAATLASAGLTYGFGGRLSLAASVGTMTESGSVLGSDGTGPYSLGPSALSGVASANLGYALDARRTVSLYADAARVNAFGPAGVLVTSQTPLTAARIGVSFAESGALTANDRLTLSVGRPFTVASGSADVKIATGREFDGTVDYDTRTLNFAGSGTPLEAALTYQGQSGALSYGIEARVIDRNIAASPKLDAHFNVALSVKF